VAPGQYNAADKQIQM